MKNLKFNFKSIVQSMAREMDERVRTLTGASIQHPISIHSASIEHPLQSGGNQVAGKYLARIWKYAAMLLMVLTLGVGQMWANTYKFTGDETGWGTWKDMTVSTDGYYEYYQITKKSGSCKINTSASYDNALGGGYVNAGFNSTNITNTWSGDNANFWDDDRTYYVLIYYKNTTVNATNNPIICASTSLPNNTPITVYYLNTNSWSSVKAYGWYSSGGADNGWPGVAMTNTGRTYNGKSIWSYTYPQSYDKAIFVDGSDDDNKTGDLTIAAGKMYNGSTWQTLPPTISGSWKYLTGGTISLTATKAAGSGTCTYQWQKKSGGSWSDISGARSETYTKSNCTTADALGYRCKITYSSTSETVYSCADGDDGFVVKVFSLKLSTLSSGTPYPSYDITPSSASEGTARVTLNASTLYYFEVFDNVDTYYGNTGYVIQNTDATGCGAGSGRYRLFAGPAGEYTFTINISQVGEEDSYASVAVSYPTVEHPAEGYTYFEKPTEWTNVYLYWYTSNENFLAAWGDAPEITNTADICDVTYYYAPLSTAYDYVIFKGDGSNQWPASGLSTSGCSGKYLDKTDYDSPAWAAFDTYTISFAKGTGTSGTMTSLTPTGGHSQTLTANSFEKTGYHFTNWIADVDVKINGSTVTAGRSIANQATLQDICGDIALTAQWAATDYTITLDRNGGSGDNQEVTATYDAGTLSASVTTPEKSGYTFDGWYTLNGGASGVGVQVINTGGTFNTSVSDASNTYTDASGHWVYAGDLTLYARWKDNGDVNKYNFQAGSGAYYGSGWTITTFAADGTILSANYTMPNPASVSKYYVGYNADFYNSSLGSNGAKSSEENMTALPIISSRNTHSHAIGTATGATGKLIAFSNSSADNLYVGFQPDGYGLTYNGKTIAFGDADAYTMRQTATVTLVSGDVSGSFKVGLKTSSGYVDCAKTTTDNASAINTRNAALVSEQSYPSIPTLATGQKGRFVIWDSNTADENNWYLAFLPVYTITYSGNDSDGGSVPASPAECINNGSFTVLGNTNSLVKTGYSFGGWTANVDVKIGGSTVTAGTTIAADAVITTVGSDITLSAVWIPVALTTSGSGTAWGTAANWSPACVPTSGHDVTIAHDMTVSTTDAKAKTVTVSTGTLTIAATGVLEVAGTITNDNPEKIVINTSSSSQGALIYDISVKPYATVNLTTANTGSGFQFIASPVGGVSVNPTFAGKGVYTYAWIEGKGWDHRGYYEDFSGDEVIVLSGDIYGCTFSGQLNPTTGHSITCAAEESNAQGVNMIPNTLTAPIKIKELEFSGSYDNGVHIHTSSGWESYAPASSKAESAVIPALQGYAVLATGSGSVSFNYDNAVRGASSHNDALRAPKRTTSDTPDYMTISVTTNEQERDLLLSEHQQFSNGIDKGWETVYMDGDGRFGELYAHAEMPMSILATDNLEGTVLGFVPGQAENYTISFEGDGRGYYLNDVKEEEATLIEEGNTYVFAADTATNATRFVISKTPIHKVPTDVDAISDGAKARKQLIGGVLYIIRDGRLYNTTGVLVK